MNQKAARKRQNPSEIDDDNSHVESDGDVDYSSQKRTKPQQSRGRVNPLASARPNRKSLESLWHVKSGAGYQLFCDYYQNQPHGVVCHDSHDSECHGNSRKATLAVSSKSSSQQQPQGKGLSRAAKRRKKKKGETILTAEKKTHAFTSSHSQDASVSPSLTPTAPSSRIINARLLEELHASSISAPGAFVSGFRAFVEMLTRPLPVMVRLRSHISSDTRQDLLQQLEIPCNHFREKDDSASESIIALWSPTRPSASDDEEDNGKSTSSTNNLTLLSIRDSHLLKLPENNSLATLLQNGTTNGTMARQEVGSMIPVLAVRTFVDQHWPASKSIRRVLDLCSSPGSKTLQLLEWMMERQILQKQKHTADNDDNDQTMLKSIVVRANDVNPRRLDELKEAMERSGVLAASSGNEKGTSSLSALNIKLKYTNEDASRYTDTKPVAYDVILADVPCSGDGTVRKDARLLPYWTPRTALGLHALQVNILCRALQLLAVDGVAVYSTCSLNPIENEAVVAAALRRMKETEKHNMEFRLIDVQVPQLVPSRCRRPGVSTWKVADYVPIVSHTLARNDADEEDDNDPERAKLVWYGSYEEAKSAGMEGALPSMWPPSVNDSHHPLDKSLRLWPQDLNTGGFFVAMIKRIK